MSEFYTSTDHFVLLPALLLALFGCATLLFDFWVFPQAKQRKWLLLFLVMGEVFAGIAYWRQQAFLNTHGGALTAFNGTLTVDQFALYFHWIFLITTLLTGLISYRYFEAKKEHHGEYYGLILLAQAGMYFLASGTDLVTIFVGLETMAVTFYVLVGFLRADPRSNEAALKYLLLGGFSSGFLAYGFSLLYGISGSTKLAEITLAVANRDPYDPMLYLALVTVTVGVLFKIAAVPFHMWAPDAYEGAPTVVTTFLAVGSKAASFALLLRLFLGPLESAREAWEPLLIAAAILSMTIGNLAAVTQTNTKRLLAYSSINHAGYMLLGVIAGNNTGIQGVLVYMLVYVFMTVGAFLVLVTLNRDETGGEDIDDLRGLMKKSPGHAVWMLIFLLSLAGIPPTAGFIGKYFIFLSLIESGRYVLAVIATVYVAVAIYYYLRLVKSMFVEDAETEQPALATSFGTRVALIVSGIATLVIGMYPEPFVRFAQQSFLR
ncbi:MAG: NADH-quinone oxidoreductase subunit N [Bryobacteraceae bacterium]|nr:NADH-quinone oxidoreductase subunit N [Solibacteraceae bacterium]MCL4844313.1 NADH-quinone oxidoreductase subunit N [Bryobacteraceae bacterium]MCO5353703.1 NADH-quinone oxidoreductase subunit N [Bryobacteraceae bacterium]